MLSFVFSFILVISYLKVEWRERKKDAEARDFNKDNIKGSHPKVGSDWKRLSYFALLKYEEAARLLVLPLNST